MAVFVFSTVFFISIRESDIGFFRWLSKTDFGDWLSVGAQVEANENGAPVSCFQSARVPVQNNSPQILLRLKYKSQEFSD